MRTLLQRKSWFCLLTLIISLFIFQGVMANIAGPTMSNTCKWWIDDDGILIFTPSSGSDCTLESGSSASDWSWNGYRSQIKGINVYPTTAKVYFGTDAAYAFADFKYCSNWAGLKYFDATNLKNASYMFQNCEQLTNSDTFKGWTPTVTNIEGLFKYCHSLTDLDLSKWDITSAVTSLNETFKVCRDGTTYGSYNTCTTDGVLKSLNLDGWDLTGVIDMSNTFEGVPSGLALNIDYCDPQKPVSYPESPYIYNKHSLADAPSDWIFEPYAVTVTFTGDGKDTGQYTRTDSNAMTNAQAYYEAVQRIDSSKTYDSTAIYYQEGKLSSLAFSTDESTHYEIAEVQRNSTVVTDYSISSMDGDYSYEVKLDKIKYKLTYLDGGANSGTVPAAADTPWDDEVTVPGNTGSLVKTGYDFAGWSDGTNVYKENDKFNMPAEDVTLTAQYTIHTYTLFYNAGTGTGTTPAYALVPFGTVVTLPLATETDYALTGNTMTGWLDAANQSYGLGGTLTMPAGDMTLSAKFTPNSYKLTYDLQGGTDSSGTIPTTAVDVVYDTSVTLASSAGLTKSGYDFDKWNNGQADVTADFNMPANDVTLTAQYTIHSYNLSYDLNGGTGTQQSATVNYNDNVTLPGSDCGYSLTGHSLTGWQDVDGNHYDLGSSWTIPAQSNNGDTITLKAEYTKNFYTLTYDLQGGTDSTGTIPDPTSYEYQQAVSVVDGSGLQKAGYTFNTWVDLGNNAVGAGTVFTMPAGDLTLKATYTKHKYTIQYDEGDADSGTLPANQTDVEYGSTVTVDANPTTNGLVKEHYYFAGWKDVDGNIYVPGGTTETFTMPALTNDGDTYTLTAVFEPNPHTLTYNKGNGDGADQTETVAYGKTINLSTGTGFSKTGHGLSSWTYGTNSYTPGSEFTMPDSDVTMTAVFTPGLYTVYYDTDGATGTTPTSTAVAYQTTVTVASGSGFTKEGYTFANWVDTADGTTTYNAGDTFKMPDKDMTLKAQYSVNSYTLSYAAGDGTGTLPASVTKPYGSTDIVVADGSGLTANKYGYSFANWTDGTNTYNAGDLFTMPAHNVTLTAEYTPNVHTLSYKAVEAESGTVPASQQVSYGTVVTAADGSGLTLTNYVFAYWTDGTNKYASGQTFTMPNADLTLEAIFAEKEYEVVFTIGSAQSGTAPASVKSDHNADGTISFVLPENTGELAKPGCYFVGWQDDKTGKTYQPGEIYTLNLASKGLLTIITVTFTPVFAKNNQEMDFYALPGAYEYDLPAAFENVTAMPGTGFSALRPTVLREQPAALEYHKTALELMLPSQEVSAAVQVIPMENGSWAVDWLGSTAGMLEGSAMPGEGPCFIAAHNHLNTTEAGPFWALSSLDVNDRLFVRDADTGELKTFSVYESAQYGPNDFAEMAAKAYVDDAGLVLITCEDEAAEGGYIHRRVVFAK